MLVTSELNRNLMLNIGNFKIRFFQGWFMSATRNCWFCIQLFALLLFHAGPSANIFCITYKHTEDSSQPTPNAWAAVSQGTKLSSAPSTELLPLSMRQTLQVATAELMLLPTTT